MTARGAAGSHRAAVGRTRVAAGPHRDRVLFGYGTVNPGVRLVRPKK